MLDVKNLSSLSKPLNSRQLEGAQPKKSDYPLELVFEQVMIFRYKELATSP